jgi:predicted HicB family RNase H-like nuclease
MVVDGVRSDVASIGELGDDAVAEVAERIADLVGRALPARILELLSDVVAEVSAELPEGRVEIRVAGDDVGLAYVEESRAAGGDGEATAELSARITLRLSEALKARVEEGAAREGVSVNTYIVRTLERGSSANRPRSDRGRNRLRGYGTT